MFVSKEKVVSQLQRASLLTWCLGRPTMDGNTARGASSPAKPAWRGCHVRKMKSIEKTEALIYLAHSGTIVDNEGLLVKSRDPGATRVSDVSRQSAGRRPSQGIRNVILGVLPRDLRGRSRLDRAKRPTNRPRHPGARASCEERGPRALSAPQSMQVIFIIA
jgi:hypothetical protein